jgi:hypothetical protein
MPNIDYTLKQVLRIYDTPLKQSFRRFNNNEYKSFKLLSPHNRLLPFQIIRQTRPDEITTFGLYDPEDDSLLINVMPLLNATDIEYKSIGVYDYITYKANKDLLGALPDGWCYAKISDGKATWYTEVFFVDCTIFNRSSKPKVNKKDDISLGNTSTELIWRTD